LLGQSFGLDRRSQQLDNFRSPAVHQLGTGVSAWRLAD
jgi:hypothetical protein